MPHLKYLDTCIILESLFEHAPNYVPALEIMLAIASGKEQVIISPLNVAEVFHILIRREKLSFDRVHLMLNDLFQSKGLILADLTGEILTPSVSLACMYKIDLTDAVNLNLMEKFQIQELYSLDSHFDLFCKIRRLTALKI